MLLSAVFERSRSVSGASTGLSSSPLSSPRVRTLPYIVSVWISVARFRQFFCLVVLNVLNIVHITNLYLFRIHMLYFILFDNMIV